MGSSTRIPFERINYVQIGAGEYGEASEDGIRTEDDDLGDDDLEEGPSFSMQTNPLHQETNDSRKSLSGDPRSIYISYNEESNRTGIRFSLLHRTKPLSDAAGGAASTASSTCCTMVP